MAPAAICKSGDTCPVPHGVGDGGFKRCFVRLLVLQLQAVRASPVRKMSPADSVQRTRRPDEWTGVPQRLFRVRPLPSPIHSRTAFRRRSRRKCLLPNRLPAETPVRGWCADTRRHVDSSRRVGTRLDSTCAAVSIYAASPERSRLSCGSRLVGSAAATAADRRSLFGHVGTKRRRSGSRRCYHSVSPSIFCSCKSHVKA